MVSVGTVSAVAIASACLSRSSLPLSTSTQFSPDNGLNRYLEKGTDLRISLPRTNQCSCGRRHLLGAAAAAVVSLPDGKNSNSIASEMNLNQVSVERFHPSRPGWYEELFARAMQEGMRSYEAKIAGYKAELFSAFIGSSKKILELGVGTGPNFKYYARGADLHVLGVDPNKQMEKYAKAAALAAGLPPEKFNFIQAVGEDLPVEDGSMDAVIGTLVLCSVKDVNMALREVRRVLKAGGLYLFIEHVAAHDGSLLRLAQSVLDPLQQFVADGCHLTRETGKQIYQAGFSTLSLNMASVVTLPIISPHVYGLACK